MKKAVNTLLLSALAFTCLAGTSQMPPQTAVTPAVVASAPQAEGEEFSFEGINYKVLSETDHTCITKPKLSWNNSNNARGEVVIPETVTKDGVEYTVVAVGDGSFYGNSGLTGIVLPSTVKTIGSEAFSQCTSLASITIPEGVEEIGDYAFLRAKIASIDIPASVSVIGKNPFVSCAYLTQINIAEGNTKFAFVDNILYSKDAAGTLSGIIFGVTTITGDLNILPSVKTIGADAFNYCIQISSINLPEGLESIGDKAFYYEMRVKTLEIPSTVTSIGEGAFGSCTALESVNILGNITTISKGVFDGCKALTSVTLPATVTSIGEEAFNNCSALADIQFPAGLTSIGYKAFTKCGFTSFVFPETVTEIGSYALSGNTKLTSITLPTSLTVLPDGLFNGCSSLESFVVPETVTDLGSSTFSSCPKLESVNIPQGVTELKNGLFTSCPALKSIDIHEGITSIGDNTFARCTGLTSIKIGSSVETIGNRAFTECSGLTSVEISNSVQSIGEYAFSNNTALTDLNLGQSITSLAMGAFYSCTALNEVVIPVSLTNMAQKAFYHCHELTDVYVLRAEPFDIPANVFYCDKYARPSFKETYIYEHATLHVPAASLEAYQQTAPWSQFSAFEALPVVALAEIPAAVYGDAAIDLAALAADNNNLVYTSSDPEVAVVEGNTLTIKGAGEVTITAERGAEMPLYTLIDNASRTLTVAKADLNATARSYTVKKGDAMPDFGIDFSGFVYDDTEADIETLPTVICSVDNTLTPGTYTLTPTGGYARNYNIISHDGTLTVSSAVGVEDVEAATLTVRTEGGEIIISGAAKGSLVEVYNAAGTLMTRLQASGEAVSYAPAAPGLYIVRTADALRKVIL